MMRSLHTPVRGGIVLAAGEGKRLQSFIHRLLGNILPKQYVNFIGTRSMLQHTFGRAEKLIPSERLFTVVGRNHLSYPEVGQQLSNRPSGTVVVQPVNKDTGPGILLPLMHLYRCFPDATTVIFPSDHFIVEEELFMAHVDLACRVVERYPQYMVLLGIHPSEPEPDYGYIVPGPKANHLAPLSIHGVSQFIEKPDRHAAQELMLRGGLWNTMVMIFKARTMVDLVCRAAPQMYRFFAQILEAIGTTWETDAVNDAYQHMQAVNFSRELLEVLPGERASCLLVLPVRGVFWSDWGSEQRVLSALGIAGCQEGRHGVTENEGCQVSRKNLAYASGRSIQ